ERSAEARDRLLVERAAVDPEHRRAHLARRRADLAVEQPRGLEVDADRQDEVLPAEEAADGDLDAARVLLHLERLDLAPPPALVEREHREDVLAVVVL